MTVAIALETRAPQAQRSEQACRAVKRPLSQGSLTRAGKPSTLCSSCLLPGREAASSGCPPRPTRSRAAARGWAGNLAAQPRQAIGAALAIAAGRSKPAMKRRSMLRLSRHHRGDGPNRQWPQRAQAASSWLPISCSAWRCGCQGCRGWPWQAASRLVARVRPARTAHTPDAGLGDALITAQSPLANRDGCPSTRRQRSVRIRPSESTGRPAVASQAGPRLPVQSRLGPLCGLLSSINAIRARSSTSWMPGSSCLLRCCSCSSRCGQRRRSASTTSRPAAPAPITRSGLGSLGSSLSRKASDASKGLMGIPAALGRLTAPTSRLSQSKWSSGLP